MHSVWCKLDVNDIWTALFYSSALRLFFDTFFWQLFSEYDDDIVRTWLPYVVVRSDAGFSFFDRCPRLLKTSAPRIVIHACEDVSKLASSAPFWNVILNHACVDVSKLASSAPPDIIILSHACEDVSKLASSVNNPTNHRHVQFRWMGELRIHEIYPSLTWYHNFSLEYKIPHFLVFLVISSSSSLVLSCCSSFFQKLPI